MASSNTSAFVIITSPEGDVMMLKRRDAMRLSRTILLAGTYELPGGAIEDEEDPIAASLRETYEETGNLLDTEKMEQVGMFKKGIKRVYFFHYHATKDEYTSFIDKTGSLLENSRETNLVLDDSPHDLQEHIGIRSMKAWEIFALGREVQTSWDYPEEFPQGIRLRRMLSLHADIALYTLMRNYSDQILAELKEHYREIVQGLSEELASDMKAEVKDVLHDFRDGLHEPYQGIDRDLIVDHKSEKGAGFAYKG